MLKELKVGNNIKDITPYPPGKPIEELEREYGITGSIKLASNENPWGPSPLALEAIRSALENLHRYPDGSSYYLTKNLAEWLGIRPEEIVLGNGSNEIIEFLVKTFVNSGDEVITSHPSFLMYQKFVQIRGGKNIVVPLKGMNHDLDGVVKAVSSRTRLVFLDNPNNPCGTIINSDSFAHFIGTLPGNLVVVLDEAYIDFVDPEKRIDIVSYVRNSDKGPPVVALRTFSKAFGLAGLRLGYAIVASDIAELLHRVRQPFNINTLAQVGGLAALQDRDHYTKTITKTKSGMEWLSKEVKELGCIPYPSHTNFFLIDVKTDSTRLYKAMLSQGVIVRSMRPYGFPEFIRITVGTESENKRFIKTLSECLSVMADE